MNAEGWMRDVIEHLRAATEPVSIATLHAHTNAAETDETASLLAEHPSVALVEGDRVTFAPHASVRTRSELCDHLCDMFPQPTRTIDLYGLYPFISHDIDYLAFHGLVLRIGDGVVARPPEPVIVVSARAAAIWHSSRSTFTPGAQKSAALPSGDGGREIGIQGPPRRDTAPRRLKGSARR
jgi:hypothetical protein